MPFEARARSNEQSATPTSSGLLAQLAIVAGLRSRARAIPAIGALEQWASLAACMPKRGLSRISHAPDALGKSTYTATKG